MASKLDRWRLFSDAEARARFEAALDDALGQTAEEVDRAYLVWQALDDPDHAPAARIATLLNGVGKGSVSIGMEQSARWADLDHPSLGYAAGDSGFFALLRAVFLYTCYRPISAEDEVYYRQVAEEYGLLASLGGIAHSAEGQIGLAARAWWTAFGSAIGCCAFTDFLSYGGERRYIDDEILVDLAAELALPQALCPFLTRQEFLVCGIIPPPFSADDWGVAWDNRDQYLGWLSSSAFLEARALNLVSSLQERKLLAQSASKVNAPATSRLIAWLMANDADLTAVLADGPEKERAGVAVRWFERNKTEAYRASPSQFEHEF